MPAASAYPKLVSELKRLSHLGETLSLLGWDEQVNLPPDSAAQRAAQMTALADLVHRESTSTAFGDLIAGSEGEALDDGQRVVVGEARKEYDRATRIPADFVARKAALESEAYHAWAEARKRNDFERFAPFLRKHIDLAFEEAGYLGLSGEAAYDYFIDRHDPGMTAAAIEAVFDPLREELVPLVREIVESPVDAPRLPGEFPHERQETLAREVTAAIGFDYRRGRLDQSVHPFCAGNGADTRMTLRFGNENPLESLFGAMHESGHGMYEQGLPAEHLGTALGENAGMGVHESQSRIWENQVGRGRPFWNHWEARVRELFPAPLQGVSSDDLFLSINAVRISPVRVEADEVTYNLHILLRFELEKRLFRQELDVADLPAEWNRLSGEILGHHPKTNAEGCLQDIHWSGGAFGYFPSYCLGNMLAAQLWYAVLEAVPGLEDSFAAGDYSSLLSWLRKHVHSKGKRVNLLTMAQSASGKPLSPDALLRYLRERYLPLYAV